MNKRILIVDDEVQILKALVRVFVDTDYEIFKAESAQQAIEMLKTDSYDLIISDMRMPHMDGYQLLCHVKEKYPNTLRIILSGYTDESIILKALQRCIAKAYILKPWDNQALLNTIEQLFETEELLRSSSLLSLINNTEKLPTIKANYQRIISAIDSDSDVTYISDLIERDQSIASKLLHVANSAFYAVKTGSVRQAVSFLGLTNVRNLVQSTSILDSMESNMLPNSHLKKMWNHAYATSKILSMLYELFLKKKLPETFMSAGLLHNIGIILFLQNDYKKYMDCYKIIKSTNEKVLTTESRILGATHCQLGGYLLKWWELPYPIIEAAMYHHQPLSPNIMNKELVMAVHISQKYAWEILDMKADVDFYEEAFIELRINKIDFQTKVKEMTYSFL